MISSTTWVIFPLLLLLLPIAFSQDPTGCDVVLEQGIYDTFRETQQSSDASSFYKSLCDSHTKYEEDKISGDVGVSYDLIGVSGGVSSDTIEALGSAICTTDEFDSTNYDLSTLDSQVLSKDALNAFVDCKKLYQAGLQVETKYDDDQEGITIDVWYVPHPGEPAELKITKIVLDPEDGWNCTGDLWTKTQESKTPNILHTEKQELSCKRKVSPVPQSVKGELVYARRGTIKILTPKGSVVRTMAPIYAQHMLTLIDVQKAVDAALNSYNATVGPILEAFKSKKIKSGKVEITNYEEPTFEKTQAVVFDEPFDDVPNIVLSLWGLDSRENDGAVRLIVEEQSVTISGFNIHMYQWNNNHNFAYYVSWLAYLN